MEKEKSIAYLTTNCSCWKDRVDTLNQLDEKDLEQMVDNAKQAIDTRKENERLTTFVDSLSEGFEDEQGNIHAWNSKDSKWESVFKAPVANKHSSKSAKKEEEEEEEPKMTPNAKNAAERLTPEELEDLAFARNERNRQRQELVTKLTANVAQEKKEGLQKVLMSKSLDELNALVDLLPTTPPATNQKPLSYVGSAVPLGNPATPTYNKKDFLPLPAMDWSEKA